MKIMNYLKLTIIIIITSMIFFNCKTNEAPQNTCVDSPLDVNNLEIYRGSVYFKVIAPDNVTKVVVNVSSADSLDQDKTIKYNLVKNATEWVGIITNLSLDSKKVAIVNAYNNNLLYTGKTNFSVLKNNTIIKIISDKPKIVSETLLKK